MSRKKVLLAAVTILVLLIFSAAAYAMAAANTVPITALEDYSATVDTSTFYPECAGYTITVGTDGNDTLYGQGGHNNCIFGLAGDDVIYAGSGNKINIIDGGPGYNICYRGSKSGTYYFYNCQEIRN